MFDWFNTIKTYYNLGLYNDANLQVFVSAGWINENQAIEIKSRK